MAREERIVVPAEMRRKLGVEPGSVLLARVEEDRLVLETRRAALERARRLFDHIPDSVSLVDELLAERREEARREEARQAARVSRRRCVLDASAVLALVRREPGAKAVEAHLETAAISAVNWCEVAEHAGAHGIDAAALRGAIWRKRAWK